MRSVLSLSWWAIRGFFIVLGIGLLLVLYLFVLGPLFGYGEPED